MVRSGQIKYLQIVHLPVAFGKHSATEAIAFFYCHYYCCCCSSCSFYCRCLRHCHCRSYYYGANKLLIQKSKPVLSYCYGGTNASCAEMHQVLVSAAVRQSSRSHAPTCRGLGLAEVPLNLHARLQQCTMYRKQFAWTVSLTS